MGIDISVACPDGFEPNPVFVSAAKTNAHQIDSNVEILCEPSDAVEDADIVYTDVFVSMGQDAERETRLNVFLPKFQVNSNLLQLAPDDAIFMHDLPCHRGEEVTDDVIDGPRSVVWDQAENRLHATKGLLALIL